MCILDSTGTFTLLMMYPFPAPAASCLPPSLAQI